MVTSAVIEGTRYVNQLRRFRFFVAQGASERAHI